MTSTPERRTERRTGRTSVLPELFDWLESGFPGLPVPRTVPGLHGIRIEEEISGNTYMVSAELPGIDPDKDVEIIVDNDMLTIRAERTETEKGKHHSEFRYGTFARSVRLPAGARPDEASAEYKDGILTVKVPLAEKAAGARTIEVRRQS